MSGAAVDSVLARPEGVKRCGKGYLARCPVHEDRKQSLSVSEGNDRRALIHCHAGCEPEAILAALGLESRDFFEGRPAAGTQGDDWTPHGPAIATYPYTDEAGQTLFTVCRTASKDFPAWHPDPAKKHGKAWNLTDVRRVLYRLPRVIEEVARHGIVHVAEGEKDVEALEAAGAVATCNPGGAGKWQGEYSECLRGAHVVIVADKDDPGRKHAAEVAASLQGKAASVVIVEARAGKDAADHLAAGYGLEDLVPVSAETSSGPAASPFVDWGTFWTRDHSDPEWTFEDVLARGRGHALYALHKDGKSLFALYMTLRCASSKERLVVVYLDYEMGEDDLYERLGDMGAGPGTDLSRLKYVLLPTLPPLDTEAGAAALMELLDAVQGEWPEYHLVVIIDTISRAVVGEENSSDTFRAFYSHTGIQLKRRGCTWARLDHAGKDASRG